MESKIEQYEQSILLQENANGGPAQDIDNVVAELPLNVRCYDEANRNPHHISLRSKMEEEIVNASK